MLVDLNQERIFIAGSRGMVGSAIQRLLNKNYSSNLLTPSKDELDLLDQEKVSLKTQIKSIIQFVP